MNFSKIAARISSAKDWCFYVDLDNTLICGVKDDSIHAEDVRKLEESGLPFVRTVGYAVVLRPGALEFLADLGAKGKVTLCTAATRDYAESICRELGISPYLDGGIISREALNRYDDETMPSECGKFVLIDDLGTFTSDVQAKLRTIGVPQETLVVGTEEELARYHIRVDEFYGNPDDRGLHKVLGKINSIG
jgi:hypothetical protein